MKKFAKYLPVEGEIEVPCIVLETLTNGKTELFQVDNFNDINLETQKLAKLFLCSRDIQVGDDIQHTSGENGVCDEIIGDALHFSGDIEGHYSSINQWFKVIGKISPKAVWVTEGMEFDEGDIAYRFSDNGKDIILQPSAFPSDEVEEWGNPSYIVIKCPTCKQFH